MAFYHFVTAAVLLLAVVHAQETSTPVPILKQVNKLNDDGSYTYGFEAADGSFRIETRDVDGTVKGKFGYIDETGELKTVEYQAGKPGFEARGAHLPEPVPVVPVAPQVPQAAPVRTAALPVVQPASTGVFPASPVAPAPALNQFQFAPLPLQRFAPQPINTVTNQQGFSFGFETPAVVSQPQLSRFIPQQFPQQPLQSFVSF